AEDLSAFDDNSLDFIVANHLLEHLPDPIAGLIEFHRVLRPDGALYMALPDSRVTFDRTRELTSPEHIIEEHRHGTAPNRAAHSHVPSVDTNSTPAPAGQGAADAGPRGPSSPAEEELCLPAAKIQPKQWLMRPRRVLTTKNR